MIRNESFDNITDSDLYVNDENAKEGADQDNLGVSNISWASLLEQELAHSTDITEHSLSSSTDLPVRRSVPEKKIPKEKPKQAKIYTPDQIIGLDYRKEEDVDVLHYQSVIATQIRKQTGEWLSTQVNKGSVEPSIDTTMMNLKWMSEVSAYLGNKIGLPKVSHRKGITFEIKVIPRASYQFCKDKHECEYNYDSKNFEGCFNQHYVHHLVKEDVDTLADYLTSAMEHLEDKEFNASQVKKCADTISFVINHMSTELRNAQYYSKVDKNLHRARLPNDKTSKKPRRSGHRSRRQRNRNKVSSASGN